MACAVSFTVPRFELRLELKPRQDRPMFDLGIASVRSERVFGSSVHQTVELQSGRRMVVTARAPGA